MTDNSLRTAIARAIFADESGAALDEVESHEMWRDKEARDTFFANADAVLAVLADPPAEAVERAKNRMMEDFGYVESENDHSFGGEGYVDVRAAFRAAFGGEQS